MCDEQNFVRSAAVGCITVPSGTGKMKIPAPMDDVQAELARLKAENEALKRQQASPFSLKVSVKGALSVYGLGRFPRDALQGAVGAAARPRGGHPRVSPGARRRPQVEEREGGRHERLAGLGAAPRQVHAEAARQPHTDVHAERRPGAGQRQRTLKRASSSVVKVQRGTETPLTKASCGSEQGATSENTGCICSRSNAGKRDAASRSNSAGLSPRSS